MRLLLKALSLTCLMLMTSVSWGADCVVNATQANFGNYNTQGNGNNRSGVVTISVSCVSTLPGVETVNYTLMINGGLSGNPVQRKMDSAGNALAYNLYSDAAMTQIWGDGAGGTSVVAGSMVLNQGRGSATVTHSAYGDIPPSQNAASGNYTDMLSVTLIY